MLECNLAHLAVWHETSQAWSWPLAVGTRPLPWSMCWRRSQLKLQVVSFLAFFLHPFIAAWCFFFLFRLHPRFEHVLTGIAATANTFLAKPWLACLIAWRLFCSMDSSSNRFKSWQVRQSLIDSGIAAYNTVTIKKDRLVFWLLGWLSLVFCSNFSVLHIFIYTILDDTACTLLMMF